MSRQELSRQRGHVLTYAFFAPGHQHADLFDPYWQRSLYVVQGLRKMNAILMGREDGACGPVSLPNWHSPDDVHPFHVIAPISTSSY